MTLGKLFRFGSCPKAGDWRALEHEGQKDSNAAGKKDCANKRNQAAETAHAEDSPVENQDTDLHDRNAEGPEHHEDV